MRYIALALILACLGCQTLEDRQEIRPSCIVKEYKFSDRAASNEFVANVTRYSAAEPSDRTILILPPTGGTNIIDRSYAKHFCRAGFDVYILNSWTGDDEKSIDFGLHQRLYTGMLKAVDFTLANVKSPFVGMFGTSLGAIYTAVALNHFDRIDAAFAVVGGAPIPELIVKSDQVIMRNLKKDRAEKFGVKTDADQIATIYQNFTLDPFKTEPKYKNKITGVFVSTGDATVNSEYQMALKDLWQAKTVYTISSGHFISIVRAWMGYTAEFTQFFIDSYEQKKNSSFKSLSDH